MVSGLVEAFTDAGDGTAVVLWLSAGPSGDPAGAERGQVSGCIRPGQNGS